MSIERALRFSAYTVSSVTTAREAQDLMLAQPIDVLLTDIALGVGMDGVALADWARKRHTLLPIMIISGLSPTNLPVKLRQDQMMRILAKPFGLGLMLRMIAELLHTAQSPQPILSKTG